MTAFTTPSLPVSRLIRQHARAYAARMAVDEDKMIYKVVVNSEEQYSLVFAEQANPPGWRDAGKQGTKAECLAAFVP